MYKENINSWLEEIKSKFLVKTYEFTLKLQDDFHIDGFIGPALRGVFGHAIKTVCCPEYAELLQVGISKNWLEQHKKEDCNQCPNKPLCLYSFLFESSSPHPFILEPPLERTEVYRKGELLTFRMVVFGYANYYAPLLFASVVNLGKIGLGNHNSKAKLERVKILYPYQEIISDNERHINFPDPKSLFLNPSMTINDLNGLQKFEAKPLEQITVQFISPLKIDPSDTADTELYEMLLRRDNQKIEATFFRHFFIRIKKRVKDLAVSYGHQIDFDFSPFLFEVAYKIKSASHLEILESEQYSNNQKRSIQFKTFLGEIILSGESLHYFMPILSVGSVIHVGRLTSAGYGEYVLTE